MASIRKKEVDDGISKPKHKTAVTMFKPILKFFLIENITKTKQKLNVEQTMMDCL